VGGRDYTLEQARSDDFLRMSSIGHNVMNVTAHRPVRHSQTANVCSVVADARTSRRERFSIAAAM
jgi:hypothetical protein